MIIIKSFKDIFATLSVLLLCASCSNQTQNERTNHEITTEYTEVFESVGFSITTPCKLQDVSSQSEGNFIINYGGVENPNDAKTMAAYQVIVNKLPVGHRDMTNSELHNYLHNFLMNNTNFSNVEKIKFGYENYSGYVGYTSQNGLKQKTVMFIKDDYIIGLNIMTNCNIESKFNKFTNGFKTITQNQLSSTHKSNSSVEKKITLNPNLPKQFTNSKFSIYFPETWSIVQENVKITEQTTIAVQVMTQNAGNYEFASNVNVIVSSQTYTESTYFLARVAFNQVKDAGIDCNLIGITDCNINGCVGSVAEYTAVIQDFTLRMWQYIVKNQDNTTYTITATIDNAKASSQQSIVKEIVNSFHTK